MNPIETTLRNLFSDRLLIPASVKEIPDNGYLVYILERDDHALVVGHGRKNRAKVIFDDLDRTTGGHIKAIFVRLHHLDATEETRFGHYVIICDDKKHAQAVEGQLHAVIQGNHREIPESIEAALFGDLPDSSIAKMLLKIAIASSFDGLYDLKSWRKKRIIDDSTWKIVSGKLRLKG
jgi:hypothetical protein